MAYRIVNKKSLCEYNGIRIVLLEIENRLIADAAAAGQFVVVIATKKGERIPLTIADSDKNKGTITIIFQEIGFTTKLLGKFNPGDSLYAVAGPMGNPTEIKKYGSVILVGGGVGVAEIFPVAKALKRKGNYIVSILGARTKDLLILETELKEVSDEVHICTDDGSYGRKGFTTDILKELLKACELRAASYELVYAAGPIPMMRLVSSVTKTFNVKTVVSLAALMVDATGMCGSCRVTVKGEVKFSCIDGPEFNAHLIEWDELAKRANIYKDKEKQILGLSQDASVPDCRD